MPRLLLTVLLVALTGAATATTTTPTCEEVAITDVLTVTTQMTNLASVETEMTELASVELTSVELVPLTDPGPRPPGHDGHDDVPGANPTPRGYCSSRWGLRDARKPNKADGLRRQSQRVLT